MTTHFAVLTPESTERFRNIFVSAPMTLDISKFVVRLGTGNDRTREGIVYNASIEWVGHKFNPELDCTEYVALLFCPALLARANELGSQLAEHELALIFQSPATPLARSNKGWQASIHNLLVSTEGPFTLVERVV